MNKLIFSYWKLIFTLQFEQVWIWNTLILALSIISINFPKRILCKYQYFGKKDFIWLWMLTALHIWFISGFHSHEHCWKPIRNRKLPKVFQKSFQFLHFQQVIEVWNLIWEISRESWVITYGSANSTRNTIKLT